MTSDDQPLDYQNEGKNIQDNEQHNNDSGDGRVKEMANLKETEHSDGAESVKQSKSESCCNEWKCNLVFLVLIGLVVYGAYTLNNTLEQ